MINIFEHEDADWVEAELQKHLNVETLKKLINVVAFYAHPDTYFAVTCIADRPAGDFADDCSECAVFDNGREVSCGIRPGKLARETMKTLFAEPADK